MCRRELQHDGETRGFFIRRYIHIGFLLISGIWVNGLSLIFLIAPVIWSRRLPVILWLSLYFGLLLFKVS